MKWKNDAAAYGSLAITFVQCCESAKHATVSKLISSPAKNCATGLFMSDGFMVSQTLGGPRYTVVNHICDHI